MICNFFKHLKTICVHKWWVFYYCCKCGLVWQGIKHDMSKFSPVEFFESVRYYQGTSSPIDAAKKDKGYSMAWQHHKGRNLHHYEHWTDNYDSGTTCIKMPFKYATEMFCDYIAAGRAYMGKNFSWEGEFAWWNGKVDIAKMHPATKEYIDKLFVFVDAYEHFPTKNEMLYIWRHLEND